MKIRTSRLTIFVETDKLMIFHNIGYANYIVKLKVNQKISIKALPSMSIDDFEKS